MTRNEALSLMQQYAAYLSVSADLTKVKDYAWKHRIEHLIGMPLKVTAEFGEAKTMRWLGYMQGQLEALGFFTLEQLKDHSRTKCLKPSSEGE